MLASLKFHITHRSIIILTYLISYDTLQRRFPRIAERIDNFASDHLR